MVEKLKRVMYLSRARHRMSHGELADLLAGARLRNEERGITGILVYEAGYFAQVIEGPEEHIDALVASIARDNRHDEFMLISEGPVDARYFEGWAMDWASLERFDDTQHLPLRRYLRDRNLENRDAIYQALVLFVAEHAQDRGPPGQPMSPQHRP